mmetsp:Transcript_1085/g.2498  ORF Transcript_1085/g.2498 Transcript_1085/m.2498 type:complete len:297 (-) Transcript_1085:778-1668(-)
MPGNSRTLPLSAALLVSWCVVRPEKPTVRSALRFTWCRGSTSRAPLTPPKSALVVVTTIAGESSRLPARDVFGSYRGSLGPSPSIRLLAGDVAATSPATGSTTGFRFRLITPRGLLSLFPPSAIVEGLLPRVGGTVPATGSELSSGASPAPSSVLSTVDSSATSAVATTGELPTIGSSSRMSVALPSDDRPSLSSSSARNSSISSSAASASKGGVGESGIDAQQASSMYSRSASQKLGDSPALTRSLRPPQLTLSFPLEKLMIAVSWKLPPSQNTQADPPRPPFLRPVAVAADEPT